MLKNSSINKGFTLIELLIVIGIIGVLAAVVLVGIDPVDKINAANDAKVQRDIGVLANAIEAWAISNNGSYFGPGGGGLAQADLVNTGNLKAVLTPPANYTCPGYYVSVTVSTEASAACQLKSKKFISSGLTAWAWCSRVGKAAATADTNTCPP